MIEFDKFKAAMIYIGKRTASAPDAELLVAYHQYLSPLLTTDEFLEAARGVFITDVFFPPPIAFLKGRMRREWRTLAMLLDDYNPPNLPEDWHERWVTLSTETHFTMKTLGGVLAFKEQVYSRNVSKAYAVFSERYVESIADLASVEQIEKPADPPLLERLEGRGKDMLDTHKKSSSVGPGDVGLPLGWEGVEVSE